MASESRRVKFARVLAAGLDVAAIAAIGYAAVAFVCVRRFGQRDL